METGIEAARQIYPAATADLLTGEDYDQQAATLSEAVRQCRALADSINADGFALFALAAVGETRRAAPVFDSSFPGILPFTRSLSARRGDDFARRAAEAAVPLWWRRADAPPFLGASVRCWAEEIDDPVAGTCGIALPVTDERGRSGAIVFFGNGMTITESDMCDLHARCYALFGAVSRQRAAESTKSQTVSKRELECLRLTANGLTSDEIAASLGLSVHTANQYLTNSTQKLNAMNRIHAVAKALRSGLID